MAKYDVIIVGGGPGGLCNAAILAKNGKKVLLLEKGPQIGGRAVTIPHEGYKLNLGWRQVEDPGSGITRVFEYLGKELRHGPPSDSMPLLVDGKWRSLQEMVDKDRSDFKKIIREITEELTWEEIETMDGQCTRPWIRKRTQSEGILTVFEMLASWEGVTEDWWDHSLSESLFMRKLHFMEKRMAAYCFSPLGGWDKMWEAMSDSIQENGGGIRVNAPVKEILVENGQVKGVEVQTRPPLFATDYPESEIIEGPCVISALTVWDVLDVVDEDVLPKWFADQIRFMARDEMRSCQMEISAGLPEPISAVFDREMPGWLKGPRTGLMGMCANLTAYDPSLSPQGEHLFVAPMYAPYRLMKKRSVVNKLWEDHEKELEEVFPVFKKRLWTKRHLHYKPSYSPIWRVGAVGRYKPDVEVPNVEGLYFAGDGFRGRSIGVDRCARIAMTVCEKILGKPIPEFKNSWHYRQGSMDF